MMLDIKVGKQLVRLYKILSDDLTMYLNDNSQDAPKDAKADQHDVDKDFALIMPLVTIASHVNNNKLFTDKLNALIDAYNYYINSKHVLHFEKSEKFTKDKNNLFKHDVNDAINSMKLVSSYLTRNLNKYDNQQLINAVKHIINKYFDHDPILFQSWFMDSSNDSMLGIGSDLKGQVEDDIDDSKLDQNSPANLTDLKLTKTAFAKHPSKLFVYSSSDCLGRVVSRDMLDGIECDLNQQPCFDWIPDERVARKQMTKLTK